MDEIYTLLDIHGTEFSYKRVEHSEYKYMLVKDYTVKLNINPPAGIVGKYYYFSASGRLIIRAGFKWDGVSGPMVDTDNTMIAGGVHDAGYRMIRRGELSVKYKSKWDKAFKKILLENGRPVTIFGQWWNSFRANYAYAGVALFGASSCIPFSQKD